MKSWAVRSGVVALAIFAYGYGVAQAFRWSGIIRPDSAFISGVRFMMQEPDFCGEACLSMFLNRIGRRVTQDEVFAVSGVDPVAGRGAYAAELTRAARHFGFRTGDVWYPVPDRDSRFVERQFDALAEDLQKGVPSIVCMRYDDQVESEEHFRLVLGYDSGRDEVIYHEPATIDGAYQRMLRQRFLSLWTLHSKQADTVIRIRLEPSAMPLPVAPVAFPAADYAQHVIGLRDYMTATATTRLVPPFVIIGDNEADAEKGAELVSWAREKLKTQFFAADPEGIVDVWLFHDDASYRRHTWKMFHHAPGTPYGFYSENERALIMNLDTGGGTLVHELVHPFVEQNIADSPPWFNEGLASLFEAPDEKGGRIVGLSNWRLPVLKAAIASNRVPPLQVLTRTNLEDFYGKHSAVYYAESRYLLYYLQEKGLLQAYYRDYAASPDRSGFTSLRTIVADSDMTRFERDWQAWVLRLPATK